MCLDVIAFRVMLLNLAYGIGRDCAHRQIGGDVSVLLATFRPATATRHASGPDDGLL